MAPRIKASPSKEVTKVQEQRSMVSEDLAALRDLAMEDEGKGLSTRAEDNSVPLIYIFQSLSPQLKRINPAYIEGAKEGDIWLRNTGIPPISGDKGILFQPCFFMVDWVEWKPNRGGFVARHSDCPADAEEKEVTTDSGDKKKVMMRKNGNIVVETRYHMGYVHFEDGEHSPMPFVIPMASSGHTVSKNWMTLQNSLKPRTAWYHIWRMKTKMTQNTKGQSWMIWDPSHEGTIEKFGPDAMEIYQIGKRLNESFASGQKTMEAPEEEETTVRRPNNDDAM